MKFSDKLREMDACSEAVRWVGRRGLKTAWRDCRRGDWMTWLVSRVSVSTGLLDKANDAVGNSGYIYTDGTHGKSEPCKEVDGKATDKMDADTVRKIIPYETIKEAMK